MGGRTPARFTPAGVNRTDDDHIQDERRRQKERIDRKSLKLRTFKGKDVDAWKSLFDDFAEQFNWSEREKKLQLKAHVEDWIRSMFTGLPPDTPADEMMARLVSRFGVNMTATEVENKLLTVERKSGEDLYTLADRIRALANRAHMEESKRQFLMRQAFFTALRGNSEMQHWVNLHDEQRIPNMNWTLDLAIEWEHQHGTTYKTEKVRQIDTVPNAVASASNTSDTANSDTEAVNKIDYIPLKQMTTEEGKRLAKQNNELVSLLRKQAYATLDEDRRSTGRSSSGRSSSGRSFHSRRGDNSSRSSSGWSRPRRSRSRDKKKEQSWRSRDKPSKGEDRWRKKSRERNWDRKDKKGGRFDKKRRDRDGRVHEVEEESQSDDDKSDASGRTISDSEEEDSE